MSMSEKIDLESLTNNQKIALERFGYFLSAEEADHVKKLIGNLKDKQAKEYAENHGSKVKSEGNVVHLESSQSPVNRLENLTTDDLLRELIKTTNNLEQKISSKLDEQTKKLGNISTAATLFIILTIIGILIGFCSSPSIY
jgi:polyhydroxyalkanoate synthesis regulator phasin